MTTASAPKTIIVKGNPPYFEDLCSVLVLPGHLLEIISTDVVKPHATADGPSARMFAIENETIGEGISDDYPIGDTVKYVHAQPGDWIYAILQDGNTSVIGGYLKSNGDGTLKLSGTIDGTTLTESLVAIAREVVVASGADAFVLIEVL